MPWIPILASLNSDIRRITSSEKFLILVTYVSVSSLIKNVTSLYSSFLQIQKFNLKSEIKLASTIFILLFNSILHAQEIDIYTPKYAQGFRIIESRGERKIVIRNLGDLTRPVDNLSLNQFYKGLALTSTTHFSLLEMLGLSNSIVAASGKKYFQKISQNKSVTELGMPINAELLKSKNGIFLITNVESNDELESIEKLKRLNISYVKMMDHLEPHLLGRSEWVVMLGYLLGKEKIAKEVFTGMEAQYLKMAWPGPQLKTKIIVAGILGDEWLLKDAKGPFGRMFLDAGVSLLEAPQKMHKEKFHELAKDANICLIEGMSTTLKILSKMNPLITSWECVKQGMIFNYDKLMNKNGGNDFWETAVMRADLLLQEYMTLIHPSLYGPNQLRWYKKIK